MSSLPWISVNYFAPLAIQDDAESNTVPQNPSDQKRETSVGPKDQNLKDPQVEKPKHPDKPRENSAEWVLCMIHQDMRKRKRALGNWTHPTRKSEVTQAAVKEILEMTEVEGIGQ